MFVTRFVHTSCYNTVFPDVVSTCFSFLTVGLIDCRSLEGVFFYLFVNRKFQIIQISLLSHLFSRHLKVFSPSPHLSSHDGSIWIVLLESISASSPHQVKRIKKIQYQRRNRMWRTMNLWMSSSL